MFAVAAIETLILGAGAAGLALGCALQSAGAHSFLILESQAQPAGLLGEVYCGDVGFDLGGHCFTALDESVRDFVSSHVELHERPRDARCYFEGALIPYPFQKHFHLLQHTHIVAECVQALAARNAMDAPRNFRDFLYAQLGEGICRHFALPYNSKLWGVPLESMSADWARERVVSLASNPTSRPDRAPERLPLDAGSRIGYPAQGLFAEIAYAMAKRINDRIVCQDAATLIDLNARVVRTASGRQYRYHMLVSTLPLHVFLPLCTPELDPGLVKEQNRLTWVPLRLAMIALDHRISGPMQRLYVADPQFPFHKVVFNNTSSPWLESKPCHGIMCECSARAFQGLSDSALVSALQDFAVTNGWTTRSSITHTKVVSIPFGYPVPTIGCRSSVQQLKTWLRRRDVRLCGRFAEWEYINSDQVIGRALNLAHTLLSGTEVPA